MVHSAAKPAFSGGGGPPQGFRDFQPEGSGLLSLPLGEQNVSLHPGNTLPNFQHVPSPVPGAGGTAVIQGGGPGPSLGLWAEVNKVGGALRGHSPEASLL